jgi:hypothetical protein
MRAARSGNDVVRAEALPIVAMAQYKLGNVSGALQALTNSNGIVDDKFAESGQLPGPEWRDWIIAHALRREADALINRGTH